MEIDEDITSECHSEKLPLQDDEDMVRNIRESF